MKSKSIFLIAVSLGFGLVAAIGITQVMGRSKAQPVKVVKKVPVLVARTDLDIHTDLANEMFVVEEWPAEIVPEGVVSSFKEIENKVNRSRVPKKGPIYLTDLMLKSEVNMISIPAGYKVMGVQLGAESHMNGLLQPGDLVDIMGVFRGGRGQSSTARTFLRKIRVFSVASRTKSSSERDPSAKGSTNVGLLVTEKQAEQITLARSMGALRLVMRSGQDDGVVASNNSDGTSVEDLFGGGGGQGSSAIADMLSRLNQNTTPETKTASDGNQNDSVKNDFVTTIYTSEGATQYRFENGVPVKIGSYESDITEEPVTTEENFDDLSTDEDSDSLIEDLDSEPDA